MVKNEEDVIGYTISHLFGEGVDLVIVADNGSEDGTREILEGIALNHNLMIVDDPEVGYYQAAKMTHLANLAMDEGAGWVIPFDADELWYSPYGRMSEVIQRCHVDLLEATVLDHRPDVTDNPDDPNPFTRMP
ncbi:MAG: glycosyltransferase family 2 protein, partial [Ignavibacteriae bacterium]